VAHRDLKRHGLTASIVPPELATAAGVIGIGVDAVDVERFDRVLARTPRVADRVFDVSEREAADGTQRSTASLAVRFAAKEAVLKVLGAGIFAVPLAEIRVAGGGDAAPALVVGGSASELAQSAGIGRWLVTLTHTDGLAIAVVAGLTA
jgi:holo-[acyl-carrier protein] synthase